MVTLRIRRSRGYTPDELLDGGRLQRGSLVVRRPRRDQCMLRHGNRSPPGRASERSRWLVSWASTISEASQARLDV